MLKTSSGLGWIFYLALWSVPLVVLLLGWIMPTQHEMVVGLRIPDNVIRGAMIIVALGSAGIGLDLLSTFFTDDRRKLIANLLAAAAWTIIFDSNAAFWLGKGTLQYWELYPAIFASISLLAQIFAGVIAAWNKNPTQITRAATI